MIRNAMTSSSSSSMAVESNTDIRLRNGLLPVSSVSDPFPAFSFASINICFHTALPSVFLGGIKVYILYFFY